ncbi:TusE/DsrC/DsvC family sulfur relay protein [Acidobacteriota bacterium]
MSNKEITGVTVNVNEEGYLTDPTQWTKEVAAAIAKEEGIEQLTDSHWKVIGFLQKDFRENGKMSTMRRIKKAGGIPTKELYQLYPDGFLKKASKIAGFPKPESCI